jgi:hypothetical protein
MYRFLTNSVFPQFTKLLDATVLLVYFVKRKKDQTPGTLGTSGTQGTLR